MAPLLGLISLGCFGTLILMILAAANNPTGGTNFQGGVAVALFIGAALTGLGAILSAFFGA